MAFSAHATADSKDKNDSTVEKLGGKSL